MRFQSSRASGRVALAMAAAMGVALHAAPASAQWAFGYSGSSGATAPRGKISTLGYVLLSIGTVVVLIPMGIAGGQALEGQRALTREAGGWLTAGGIVAGGSSTFFLTRTEPDAVAFASTTFTGLSWSVAGVGVGAAASTNPRAPWLGGSMALGAFAIARAGMAFGGVDDYAGAAWAQALLGALGGAGCLADAAAIGGYERTVGATCAGVSFAASILGMAMSGRREPPPPPPSTGGWAPVPLLGRGTLGLSLAGRF